MRTSLICRGSVVSSREVKSPLSITLLPLPVVPATSRCGISERSKKTARPEMSLPSPTGRVQSLASGYAWNTSPSVTFAGLVLGTSTPTALLPGIGASILTSVAARAYAISCCRFLTLPTLTPLPRRRLPLCAEGLIGPAIGQYDLELSGRRTLRLPLFELGGHPFV